MWLKNSTFLPEGRLIAENVWSQGSKLASSAWVACLLLGVPILPPTHVLCYWEAAVGAEGVPR